MAAQRAAPTATSLRSRMRQRPNLTAVAAAAVVQTLTFPPAAAASAASAVVAVVAAVAHGRRCRAGSPATTTCSITEGKQIPLGVARHPSRPPRPRTPAAVVAVASLPLRVRGLRWMLLARRRLVVRHRQGTFTMMLVLAVVAEVAPAMKTPEAAAAKEANASAAAAAAAVVVVSEGAVVAVRAVVNA